MQSEESVAEVTSRILRDSEKQERLFQEASQAARLLSVDGLRRLYLELVRRIQAGTPPMKDANPGRAVEQPVTAKPETARTKVKGKLEDKPTKTGVPVRPKTVRRKLKEDIKTVLGERTMNATQVYEALSDQGWLPISNNPKGYVAYTLSAFPEKFARMSRGQYRVETPPVPPPAPPAPPTSPALAPDPLSRLTPEEILQEAGILSPNADEEDTWDELHNRVGDIPPANSHVYTEAENASLREVIVRVVGTSYEPLSAIAVLADVRQFQPDADKLHVGGLLFELADSGDLVKYGFAHRSRFGPAALRDLVLKVFRRNGNVMRSEDDLYRSVQTIRPRTKRTEIQKTELELCTEGVLVKKGDPSVGWFFHLQDATDKHVNGKASPVAGKDSHL